jgi:hypothetical protein
MRLYATPFAPEVTTNLGVEVNPMLPEVFVTESCFVIKKSCEWSKISKSLCNAEVHFVAVKINFNFLYFSGYARNGKMYSHALESAFHITLRGSNSSVTSYVAPCIQIRLNDFSHPTIDSLRFSQKSECGYDEPSCTPAHRFCWSVGVLMCLCLDVLFC